MRNQRDIADKLSGILFHANLSRKWNDASGVIVKE
jgi:hypothetical protein